MKWQQVGQTFLSALSASTTGFFGADRNVCPTCFFLILNSNTALEA